MEMFKLFYTVLGGLGIFFLGMKTMSNALQESAGDLIRKAISTLTSNRYMAVVVGTLVTMTVQSSSVTTVMVLPPYLACTAYLWKICKTNEYPENLPVKKRFATICGIAGSLYVLWMIYAAGISYLLMAFCFLTAGIPVYILVRIS